MAAQVPRFNPIEHCIEFEQILNEIPALPQGKLEDFNKLFNKLTEIVGDNDLSIRDIKLMIVQADSSLSKGYEKGITDKILEIKLTLKSLEAAKTEKMKKF